MKFEPILLNNENQDPVLLVPIPQRSQMAVFDLGYCFRLKVRDIQRIDKIFISHTHMDHFVGFDHLLRLCLDTENNVEIFGPPGIIANVEGKLSGYSWNLAEGGRVTLSFSVNEIHPNKILNKKFFGSRGFVNSSPPDESPADYIGDPMLIFECPEYKVECVFLEHRMPVLAYRMTGAPSFNADIEVIKSMGLQPGKWVGDLKDIAKNGEGDKSLEIDGLVFNAGEMAEKIIKKAEGTVITYVVDTIFNKSTAKALKKIARDADYFFCEGAYLTAEKDLARENYHLTAKQAATIALEGESKSLILLHFSRRYEGQYFKIFDEAKEVFNNLKKPKRYKE